MEKLFDWDLLRTYCSSIWMWEHTSEKDISFEMSSAETSSTEIAKLVHSFCLKKSSLSRHVCTYVLTYNRRDSIMFLSFCFPLASFVFIFPLLLLSWKQKSWLYALFLFQFFSRIISASSNHEITVVVMKKIRNNIDSIKQFVYFLHVFWV